MELLFKVLSMENEKGAYSSNIKEVALLIKVREDKVSWSFQIVNTSFQERWIAIKTRNI